MKLRSNWFAMLLTLLLSAGSLGCGDDDGDEQTSKGVGRGKEDASAGKSDSGAKPGTGSDDELEVAGDWQTEFGDQSISVDDWDGAMVVEFDNDENVAFTQYADDAEFNPGKFSKLVWLDPTDEGFYYCTIDFGLDSLAAAKA